MITLGRIEKEENMRDHGFAHQKAWMRDASQRLRGCSGRRMDTAVVEPLGMYRIVE